MSATLTPHETVEDIALLEEILEEDLACYVCSAIPAKMHIRRCCGTQRLYCASDSACDLNFLKFFSGPLGGGVHCTVCGVEFIPLKSPEDAVRVVTL